VGLTSAFKVKPILFRIRPLGLNSTSRPDCLSRRRAQHTKKPPPVLPDESSAPREIFFFQKYRNYDLRKSSRPHEGRFAIVTIRGAGCDGRGWRADDARRKRTVKPCGPGTPTLVLSLRSQVDRRQRLTSPVLWGERGAAVKPLRRECRAISALPDDLWAFSFSAHEDCGCG
jgi:hypothetical protein